MPSFEACTALCMANPICESVKLHVTPMGSLCKLFSHSWDTNHKTCSIPDTIGGRKCHRLGCPFPDSTKFSSVEFEIWTSLKANENANRYFVTCALSMVTLFMKDVLTVRVLNIGQVVL